MPLANFPDTGLPRSETLLETKIQRSLGARPIEFLRSEFDRSDHVRNLPVSYSETQLAQVQQTAACNAMHTIDCVSQFGGTLFVGCRLRVVNRDRH
jgi:hypothetical protein